MLTIEQLNQCKHRYLFYLLYNVSKTEYEEIQQFGNLCFTAKSDIFGKIHTEVHLGYILSSKESRKSS